MLLEKLGMMGLVAEEKGRNKNEVRRCWEVAKPLSMFSNDVT